MSIESLKTELSRDAQKGANAKILYDLQLETIKQMKQAIVDEMSLLSMPKTVKRSSIFGFNRVSVTETGVEQLQALQSDLRVINGYEALLNQAMNIGEMAKANIEKLEKRS